MKARAANIFASIPDTRPEECFEEILRTRSFRLERIVSRGHTSHRNQWYDQAENEWVIVLQGRARLEIRRAQALWLVILFAAPPVNTVVIAGGRKRFRAAPTV